MTGEETPEEPFPSRNHFLIYGGASMVIAVILAGAGNGDLAGMIAGLGVAALARAFWMSWGL